MPEIRSPEFREVIYRRTYRVIYRLEKSRVVILTVRNCAELLDLPEVQGD